ncbi:MAG: Holliday junction resolvase RuvX [Bacteroidia bacterium]|nr:Holliday junction resolvase RuvX [Bacteroidia bacterium]
MARILAIDIGSKLCGLAWSDPSQLIATQLGSVHRKELLARIADFLNQEPIERIIVGYPKNLNGKDTHMTLPAEQLKTELETKFQIPVVLWDERFTSQMAFQSLIDAGASKKKRQDKELINTISASILLQSYLDSQTV